MTTIEFSHPTDSAESFPARKIFTRENIEKAMGAILITASFLLTGWFYYNLYLALHNHEIF
jgi:hypothetical protein